MAFFLFKRRGYFMGFEVNKFKFINIDQKYLKALHDQDSEVFYSEDVAYNNKPYIGILVHSNDSQYAIPLTSAKPKHLGWKPKTDTNFIIFEDIDKKNLRPKDIFKPLQKDQVRKILSVMELKKMIPIKDGLYSYINFDQLAAGSTEDKSRKDLLEKEYYFCIKIKSRILEYASKMYDKQIESGIIIPFQCDFKKLEEICNQYSIVPGKENTTQIVPDQDETPSRNVNESFLKAQTNTFESEAAAGIDLD